MILGDLDSVIRYYESDAAAFAARYDSLRFEDVHPGIDIWLPAPPARILDVGAGSGRDARALARLGFNVTAAEPTAALYADALPSPGVRWIDDRLPDLPALADEGERYAFILCSAVLMLLRSEELGRSLAAMARLLAPGGRLALSLRDPVAGEPSGIFHRHSDAALLAAASHAGLDLLETEERPDALGRAPHRWRSFVFARRPSHQPTPDAGARKIS